MRKEIFKKLSFLAVNHAWKMIIFSVVLTIAAGKISENLTMSMRWSDLLPLSEPSVQEYNKIIEDYNSASSIFIVVQGDENRIKDFAGEIAGPVTALKDIKRVDYRINADFIKNHGFMLSKTRDLQNSEDMFSNLNLKNFLSNLNNNLEKTYVYNDDEEKLSNKEKTDEAISSLESIKKWLESIELYCKDPDADKAIAETAVDRFLLGEQYFLSYNKRILLMIAQPDFSMTDIDKCISSTDAIQAIIDKAKEKYPGTDAGMAGGIALCADEMRSMEGGMFIGMFVALILIIGLFVFAFRMWISPLLALIALLMGVTWTFGFATITVGSLNMFTYMMGIVLVGLGIDFSIHIISSFTENRRFGFDIKKAMENTFNKAGSGVLTGALTTSIAFFTLCIAENRGMKEFGLICGGGVVLTMMASFIVLPPMLVLVEKWRLRKGEKKSESINYEFNLLGNLTDKISRTRWAGITVILLFTVFMIIQIFNIKFDYNMLNIEPEGIPSVVLPDTLIKQMDMSPDMALVTATDFDTARALVKKAKQFKNIAAVDCITDYLPSKKDQIERAEIINRIKSGLIQNNRLIKIKNEDLEQILNELNRLWMNITEMSTLAFQSGQERLEEKCYDIVENSENENSSDYIKNLIKYLNADFKKTYNGLNRFQDDYFHYFRKNTLLMANPEEITLSTIPENIINQFQSNDGSKYLVSIYPKQNVWDLDGLKTFTQQVRIISPRGTGTPPLMLTLIEIIGKDGKIAAVLAVFIVFILLLIDFKKIRDVILAMVPLIAGSIWMVGMMSLFDIKLNVVNVMALPLIIGIGIDDGVHIVHRFRIEGSRNIKTIFSSCGKAVLLTSLTTMISFASLGFLSHRGMVSMGVILVIGIGCCFLTTVLILSILFRMANHNGNEHKIEQI